MGLDGLHNQRQSFSGICVFSDIIHNSRLSVHLSIWYSSLMIEAGAWHMALLFSGEVVARAWPTVVHFLRISLCQGKVFRTEIICSLSPWLVFSLKSYLLVTRTRWGNIKNTTIIPWREASLWDSLLFAWKSSLRLYKSFGERTEGGERVASSLITKGTPREKLRQLARS